MKYKTEYKCPKCKGKMTLFGLHNLTCLHCGKKLDARKYDQTVKESKNE